MPNQKLKTHWDNPWKDAVVVPIDELVLCDKSLGQSYTDLDGSTKVMTKERLLEYYQQYGTKVDAYVLPNKPWYSMGIRYGNKGPQYLSPMGDDKKLRELYRRYSNERQ